MNSGLEDILRHLWNQSVARSTSQSGAVLEVGVQPQAWGGARGRLSGSLRDVRPLGEDFHSVLANGPFQDGDGSKGIGLEMFFQGRVLKQKVVGGDVFLQ